MGHYRITIEGCGSHHNKIASDAENLASDFVEQLKRRGHTVESATFELASGRNADHSHQYALPEPIKPPDATIDLERQTIGKGDVGEMPPGIL